MDKKILLDVLSTKLGDLIHLLDTSPAKPDKADEIYQMLLTLADKVDDELFFLESQSVDESE